MRILEQRKEVMNIISKLKYYIIFLLIFFILIFIRVAYLQVFQGDKFEKLSRRNFTISEEINAPRGNIYSGDGKILASTKASFEIRVIPLLFVKTKDVLEEQVERLDSVVDLTSGELRRLTNKLHKCHGQCRYHPVTVKEGISRKTILEISAYLMNIPGVIIGSGFKRIYPFSETTSHITGYVSKISEKELELYPSFSPQSFTGKSGLERSFEEELHGKSGKRFHMTDHIGRIVEMPEDMKEEVPDTEKPVKGADIHTTFRTYLQKTVAEAFEDKSGAAIAMDIHSGDILLMYSSPGFNPNRLSRKRIPATVWEQYSESSLDPLVNKTISQTYYPGSTFKIVTAMAGLYHNAIDEKTTYFCNHCLRFGDNYRKCCWKNQGHKWVDMRKSIKESCDIFYYRLVEDLGYDNLISFAKLFNLDRKTGIHLHEEKTGTLPTQAWYRANYPGQSLNLGYMMNIAIGQGDIRLTPLQITSLYASVFNGGLVIKPRIVEKVIRYDDSFKDVPVSVVRKLDISEDILSAIKKSLWAVTNEKGGTAYFRADRSIPDAAGKTGTSQVISKTVRDSISFEEEERRAMTMDHAFFSGVFPYDNPRIAASVVVEHGGSGGAVAAPIVYKIFKSFYQNEVKNSEK